MCTFEVLAACFSLSGFYVEGGLSHRSQGEPVVVESSYRKYSKDYTVYSLDSTSKNPYGRLAMGYDVTIGKWATALEYSHESSLGTRQDRGVERLSLSVTWRPFK